MDFEFTKMDRRDTVLVSGAMSHNSDERQPVKLEGRPIILRRNNKLEMFNIKNLGNLIHAVKRNLWKKPDLIQPLLRQIYESINHKGRSSLTPVFISHYLHTDNRPPIIVLWNGLTDRKILEGLRIPGIYKMLDMTAFSDDNNGNFNLKLLEIGVYKKTLFSTSIGRFNKNGRMLNLSETHAAVCDKNHIISYCHDPVTDVILSKCIFNYIILKFPSRKFNKLCRSYIVS